MKRFSTPPMTRSSFLFLCAIFLTTRAFAQGYAPEEAVGHMTLEEGFEASLVAGEPDIRQPVAIEFDDRGRLWTIQYLQYPNPEGLERVAVDRYSRTVYDRVPKPPPHGPKGVDRITIVEDTDGDGKGDLFKDFVDGLNLTTGITFGYGGVFVLNVPYLLFYPDRDRDDVPDGDPVVCLEGFGMQDAHSVANSLTIGPDGWLYGLQGSTVSANIRGVEFQQGMWRYHPLTKEFELFCEGGGNMWGLDYDLWGNMIASTNVGARVGFHLVQGGYYWKSFGKHGDLHNPYAYGYFDHVPHDDFEGGHVTVGGLFYYGDSFPDAFRGRFIGANLLTHDIYWHTVETTGATFKTVQGNQLLDSHDSWCAPCDAALGPDGAYYFADWHDKRTAHPDPDADWDRSNGRVFRVQAEGAAIPEKFALGKLSSAELVDLLTHPNRWYARQARTLLASRRDASVIPTLRKWIFEASDEKQALEGLWGVNLCGGFNEELALKTLDHKNEHVRRWTVRLLGDDKRVSDEGGAALVRLAGTETDVVVRSQLASTAQRLPARLGLEIASALLDRDLDAGDPYVPLLLWWAVEKHAIAATEQTLKVFASDEAWNNGLIREEILPRLVRRYCAEGSEEADLACLRLLKSAPGDTTEPLAWVEQGLKDRRKTISNAGEGSLFVASAEESGEEGGGENRRDVVAPDLQSLIQLAWERDRNDTQLLSLANRVGVSGAYDYTKDFAADPASPTELRTEAIRLLGDFGGNDCFAPLLDLVRGSDEPALANAAIEAIRRVGDKGASKELLEIYPTLSEPHQSKMRDTLFAKKEWARAFLLEVDSGAIDPETVPIEQLRKIALHEDSELDEILQNHWGRVGPGTPGEKLAEMRRLNNDLNAGTGDLVRGREVFTEVCAKCHKFFEEGEDIGPDLTHSNRFDREYLLVSLVDPSLVVRKEFQQFLVETLDGSLHSGLVIDQTPGEITVVGGDGEKTVLSMDDVLDIQESTLSVMPEDLYKNLTPDQLRDLVGYLQSEGTKEETQ